MPVTKGTPKTTTPPKPKGTGFARLMEVFDDNQIKFLARGTIANEKWKLLPKAHCDKCGGYHATTNTIHLAYVGHAPTTARLCEVDPKWSWAPFALDERKLPAFDKNGGLWINLTVLGVTKPGYGHAPTGGFKTPGDVIKEIIGDAIRNAAMRFGVALDLWHKGDVPLFGEDDHQKLPAPPTTATMVIPKLPQPPDVKPNPAQRTGEMKPAGALLLEVPKPEAGEISEAVKKILPRIEKALTGKHKFESEEIDSFMIQYADVPIPELYNSLDKYVIAWHGEAGPNQ